MHSHVSTCAVVHTAAQALPLPTEAFGLSPEPISCGQPCRLRRSARAELRRKLLLRQKGRAVVVLDLELVAILAGAGDGLAGLHVLALDRSGGYRRGRVSADALVRGVAALDLEVETGVVVDAAARPRGGSGERGSSGEGECDERLHAGRSREPGSGRTKSATPGTWRQGPG